MPQCFDTADHSYTSQMSVNTQNTRFNNAYTVTITLQQIKPHTSDCELCIMRNGEESLIYLYIRKTERVDNSFVAVKSSL
jgi:hypothetical protein